MLTRSLFAVLMLFNTNVLYAGTTDAVSFMAGCWKAHRHGSIMTENWTTKSRNLMLSVASNRREDNTIDAYEFKRIQLNANADLIFTGYPNGTQAADFTFDADASQDANNFRAVFVNEAGIFPKRISYSRPRADAGRMVLVLSGLDANGQPKEERYPMFRANCNNAF